MNNIMQLFIFVLATRRSCSSGSFVDSFKEHWPDAWPNTDSALKEVQESLEQIESAEWQLMKVMQFRLDWRD